MITPLTYQILLSLADADRHGYGIIREIEERLGGGAAPSTGALYLAVQRMERDGLIIETDPVEEEDARRRYYTLTKLGRQVAEEESRRLAALVATARRKHLLIGKAGA